MRLLVYIATVVLLAPPVSGPDDDNEPKIEINVPREHMLNAVLAGKGFGKPIRFGARLKGEPEDIEKYYCLDEVWDWGDGTQSVHEPDCDPYSADSELKRDFSDTHVFGPGRWYVAFGLMHMDDVIIKANVEIRVH